MNFSLDSQRESWLLVQKVTRGNCHAWLLFLKGTENLKTSRGAGQAEVLMSFQPLPLVAWPGPTCSPQQPCPWGSLPHPLRASLPIASPLPPTSASATHAGCPAPCRHTMSPEGLGGAAASTPSFPTQQRWIVLLPEGNVGLPPLFLQQHLPQRQRFSLQPPSDQSQEGAQVFRSLWEPYMGPSDHPAYPPHLKVLHLIPSAEPCEVTRSQDLGFGTWTSLWAVVPGSSKNK